MLIARPVKMISGLTCSKTLIELRQKKKKIKNKI